MNDLTGKFVVLKWGTGEQPRVAFVVKHAGAGEDFAHGRYIVPCGNIRRVPA